MFLFAVALGAIMIIVGIVVFYYGMKMPEDKKVDVGAGTYYDSWGVMWRAIFVIVVGVILLLVGLVSSG